MAITHVHPLLLLLASTFFLPAIRAIDFKYCNKSGYEFANVSRVEVSPNPIKIKDREPLWIVVFGYASTPIVEGTVDVNVKYPEFDERKRIKSYKLCDVSQLSCVIRAGTKFVLNLREVPVDQTSLELGYKYGVTLNEEDIKVSKYPIVRVCVEFNVGISALTMVTA